MSNIGSLVKFQQQQRSNLWKAAFNVDNILG